MADLTSVAAIKTQFGISDTTEDSQLAIWLDAAERAIAMELNRKIVDGIHPLKEVEVTEYFNGRSMDRIAFSRYPVSAVDSVYLDSRGYGGQVPDSFGAEKLLTVGVDYVWDEHYLKRLGGDVDWKGDAIWPDAMGSVKVTYTAGYSTIPGDIVHATMLLVGEARRRNDLKVAYGTQSEQMGRAMVSMMQSGKSKDLIDAWQIIQHYAQVN